MDFCPEGYLPTEAAILAAAECWFYDEFARIDTAAAAGRQSGLDKGVDALALALSQAQIPDELQLASQSLLSEVVHRLRNFLHLGKLTSYYFGGDGRQPVSRAYWATAQADGAIESSTYWPFGKPSRGYEERPHYALFFEQSELDALFNERSAESSAFPAAKMKDFVAALRLLDHLPSRKEQREALRKLPEFSRYHLTDKIFREAEKQIPREPGRKPTRPKH
jgi:hypothetical protein